jgi:uncharacterized membrane protein YfcA
VTPAHIALIAVAAVAGGAVNAIAGGGSLLTFPALLAAGMPAVQASLTNTVAMCPGYVGATIAQRQLLSGQRGRAAWILPAGAIGGVGGALLLLASGESAFDLVVPFLLVFAALLLGVQPRLRDALAARGANGKRHAEAWAAVPVGLAAVYGGYFGAGLGVIVLAALAVVYDRSSAPPSGGAARSGEAGPFVDDLVRVNALKQAVSLVVNVAAAIVFVAVGHVDWLAAAVMAGGSLAGGLVGGLVASRVPAGVLRAVVITSALAVAGYYFSRLL